MTLLMGWVGVDNHGITSLYIGADSRYSWGAKAVNDGCVKVFGCSKEPHIFGFCGDVTFATNVIHHVVSQIDSGILLTSCNDSREVLHWVSAVVDSGLNRWPKNLLSKTVIFHGFRLSTYVFGFAKYKIENGRLQSELLNLPKESGVIDCEGSGKSDFTTRLNILTDKDNDYRTCRLMYNLLQEAIEQTSNYSVGGVPQIVGLYRKFNARNFGILKNGHLYFNGACVDGDSNLENIEWRNDNFERVDTYSMGLLPGAQRQPFVRSNSLPVHNLIE